MKKFILYISLLFVSLQTFSQENEIGGQVNQYWSVTDVQNTHVDLAVVPAGLQPGDKVILMQMTGIEVLPTGTWPITNLIFSNLGTAGKFEMLAVSRVNSNQVEFTVTIDASNYTPDETMQLVKIYEADYATVTSPITAKKWDGTTGGVIALVIFKKLTLNDDIIASNRGFRGGQTEPGFVGGCRENATDTLYFHSSVNGIAGSKGEGNVEISATTYSTYTKGPGPLALAGGGGLGYFAGGGGGAHYGDGGSGGAQQSTCSTFKYAIGGEGLKETDNFYGYDRVTMGGGGGSSTEDIPYIASKGGDGGGIIIIMTDTLVGEVNRYISNRGESAANATAGAGGGGAGGSILLDVNVFSDELNLDVQGGDGGSTGVELTGAGGGGGGGIIWHNGTSLPGNVSSNVLRGDGGDADLPILGGVNGSPGKTLGNLQLPLNGFLFNTIEGTDTICEGQKPKLILASTPRSQSTSYIYEWLQSTDSVNWVLATGTGDLLSFQPDELTETTYFTRMVLDTLTDEPITDPAKYVYDTAFAIKVFVFPALSNNILDFHDTLCFNQSPGTLAGTMPTGGDNSYQYNWHSNINLESPWTAGRSINPDLTEGNLTQTTYYRRIVTSHEVCVDTSNTDSITVLPAISNNSFSPLGDTAICKNSDAGLVRATTTPQLGGGNGNYTFKWIESTNNISYDTIIGAVSANYSPGELAEDMYYKRIVYSGPNTVCKSITPTSFYLEVYDFISLNSINGSGIQYACMHAEKSLGGSEPGGGSGNYNYNWEQWVDGTGWDDADGENNDKYYTSSPMNDTLSFRRLVFSGDYDQCKDTSDAVLIRINPLPTGDIEAGVDTFCAEGVITVQYNNLTGNGPWTITVGEVDNPINTTEPPLTDPEGTFSFEVTQSASIKVLEIKDDSSCLAMDTNFVHTVEVVVYERPEANAGNDPEACGLTASMAAEPSVGSGLWSGQGIDFDDPSSPESEVTATEYGTYDVTWTETNWICTDAEEIELTFYEQPEVASVGEDQILDYTFNTTLEAEAPDVGLGNWLFVTGSGTIEEPTVSTTRVDFPDLGSYELSWVIGNGTCDSVRSSVMITINDLAIFNGFSPNGDGVNDEFILKMSGRNPAKLLMLDKWGRKIVETEGRDELIWNGENKNGEIMPEGTYFYIIKEEGLSDRQGYIELRR